jgi:type III secretory pathway component EscS
MSPAAKPVPALPTQLSVPVTILQEGEVVILAKKPSPWFVLLVSLPVLAAAAAVAMLAILARGSGAAFPLAATTLLFVSLAAACMRVLMASYQWASRLYMLTNLRVLRVRGLWEIDILECPLHRLTEVQLLAAKTERLLGVGTIVFSSDKPLPPEALWLHISQPAQALELINNARGNMTNRPK